MFSEQPWTSSPILGYHQFSADRYFHLPNLVGQKDFHLPKRNFHLPNGSLVGAFRHPVLSDQNFGQQILLSKV